jgi:hypothetical protein
VESRAQPTQIPISALNHYSFRPRHCALIHLEGICEENASTLTGRFDHDEVDTPAEGCACSILARRIGRTNLHPVPFKAITHAARNPSES